MGILLLFVYFVLFLFLLLSRWLCSFLDIGVTMMSPMPQEASEA